MTAEPLAERPKKSLVERSPPPVADHNRNKTGAGLSKAQGYVIIAGLVTLIATQLMLDVGRADSAYAIQDLAVWILIAIQWIGMVVAACVLLGVAALVIYFCWNSYRLGKLSK